jgi:hypothetical protein
VKPVTGLGKPEQHQIADIKDEGSRALGGGRDSVLWVLETEQLLDVAKADFQGPASGGGSEDFGGMHGEVAGEEAVIATADTRITHYDDAKESLPRTGIYETEYSDQLLLAILQPVRTKTNRQHE